MYFFPYEILQLFGLSFFWQNNIFPFFVPYRPKIGRRTMHQISWPKYDPTPGGSNKVAEVKVSMWAVSVQFKQLIQGLMWLSFFFLPIPGGFQGIPGSQLRQPGPRGNLRHMSPGGSGQGPRGLFVHEDWKKRVLAKHLWLRLVNHCFICFLYQQLRAKQWLLVHPWESLVHGPCLLTNTPQLSATPTLKWCNLFPYSRYYFTLLSHKAFN